MPRGIHDEAAPHDLRHLGCLVAALAGRTSRISVRRRSARMRAISSRCEKGLAI
jgi:hypothetical protein